MTKEEKQAVVANLTEQLNDNQTFYITDASGLTVEQTNAFRRLCFEKGIEYKVAKNTLIEKALENLEGDFSDIKSVLNGFSGILFSGEVGNLPAKVLLDYRKNNELEKPLFKAASINAEFYFGDEMLNELSKLKSKDELLGEIITLLQSPAKNVVSALQSGQSKLAGIVKTLSEREN
ncbi:MAG: 50S ribosomal protein L10 [Bacteroidota bacterium]